MRIQERNNRTSGNFITYCTAAGFNRRLQCNFTAVHSAAYSTCYKQTTCCFLNSSYIYTVQGRTYSRLLFQVVLDQAGRTIRSELMLMGLVYWTKSPLLPTR